MVQIILKPSSRKEKKFMAIMSFDDGRRKTVHFGQKGASDYTIHKDNARKLMYITRHKKREAKFWTPHNKVNLQRPSYWSRWLLWNKPTLKASKKFIEDKQNIDL